MTDLNRLRALAGMKKPRGAPSAVSQETINSLKEVTLSSEIEIGQVLHGDDAGLRAVIAILHRSFRIAARRGATSIQDFQRIADAVLSLAPAYRDGDEALRTRIAAMATMADHDHKNA